MPAQPVILAGDIGGTKTALALVTQEDGARQPLAHATFPSGSFASLDAIVLAFLAGKDVAVQGASFGVAGPIIGRHAQITNLLWGVDADSLSRTIGGAPVHLLNDLQAIAHAIPRLIPSELETLNTGAPQEGGALAVIAPGTGLGEAFMVWSGGRYLPYPSEGGHADFAPSGALERDLLAYLEARFGHVSNERVCSGLGLPNLYSFLKDSGRAVEPAWLSARLAAVSDRTPVIVQVALEDPSGICAMALDLFVSILGSEAGNLALKVLATRGVYIGGGIPPRILARLQGPLFMRAFTAKGRFSDLLSHIPVHVIIKLDAALFGAACHALESYG